MTSKWINKNGKKSCIVFFNGWGMNESILPINNNMEFDLFMCYNYNGIEDLNKEEFKQYDNIHLVAWSLGVYAASVAVQNCSLTFVKKIAINGTMSAIDDSKGIPKGIFVGTIRGWNDINRDKFNLRMMGNRTYLMKCDDKLSKRSAEDQKQELEFLFKHISENDMPEYQWDKVIIGEKDLIFTADNQKNAWENHNIFIEEKMPHFPFNHLKTWQEIIA